MKSKKSKAKQFVEEAIRRSNGDISLAINRYVLPEVRFFFALGIRRGLPLDLLKKALEFRKLANLAIKDELHVGGNLPSPQHYELLWFMEKVDKEAPPLSYLSMKESKMLPLSIKQAISEISAQYFDSFIAQSWFREFKRPSMVVRGFHPGLRTLIEKKEVVWHVILEVDENGNELMIPLPVSAIKQGEAIAQAIAQLESELAPWKDKAVKIVNLVGAGKISDLEARKKLEHLNEGRAGYLSKCLMEKDWTFTRQVGRIIVETLLADRKYTRTTS